jgi:ubiquinone/menaquinone biosynthesis C-methylase UbiE
MGNTALKTAPFEEKSMEYDDWFEKYHYVFESEVEALRAMLPPRESYGIEVGLGTGRFSVALGIKEGVESAFGMRVMALTRGIEVRDAIAEKLPYKDLRFEFVLMASCINYFYDMHSAFKEAHRVLKKGGSIIIGFIEKNSRIARFYEQNKNVSNLYKQASFYSIDKVVSELHNAGFNNLEFSQTLFSELEAIHEYEPAIKGYGNGSYVVIKALKK